MLRIPIWELCSSKFNLHRWSCNGSNLSCLLISSILFFKIIFGSTGTTGEETGGGGEEPAYAMGLSSCGLGSCHLSLLPTHWTLGDSGGEVLGTGSEMPLSMRVLGVSGHELCSTWGPSNSSTRALGPLPAPSLEGQGGQDAPGIVQEFLNQ